ncbi:MAG: ATP-dependent helicase [Treponema sp.]|jgi:DNA helicase-2/ATP-dependent DNA helicase PcrA|nr:ATP-dependent helicase [Treponema sp.]
MIDLPPQLPPYLQSLNAEQLAAVLHDGLGGGGNDGGRGDSDDGSDGNGCGGKNPPRRPLLILAGAGSGKTRVITTKIAYLIRERGIDPRSILAVTFTNKAAREMAGRARLIDPRAGDAMTRTFHSFGAWFLRRHAALASLNPGFVIYDDDDAVSLLGTIREEASRAELRRTAALISRAKDYFLSPADPDLDLIDHRPEFRKTYARYEERLGQIGNVDFGDLIKKPVEILRANGELAERIRSRFRVIMVDEYQDANIAQFRLLAELVNDAAYLCVVGDDDQSIYRFRGAEVKNILEFPDRFPGTDIIRLERNYRSFAPILALASRVVDHNAGRLGKTLRAERGPGRLPTLAFLPDQDEEAAFCAELILRSVRDGAAYTDWAILYRTNAQSLEFETELLRRRIPYRVVGSLKFYEREEIKDALALLALLVNPLDEVAFRRVINKPPRGVGAAALDKILKAAYRDGGNDADGVNETDGMSGANGMSGGANGAGGLLAIAGNLSLSAKARAGIEHFSAFMEKARALLYPAAARPRQSAAVSNAAASLSGASPSPAPIRPGEGLSVCAASLILDSGLAEYHGSHDEINGYQRIGNLQELVNASSLYPASPEGLAEFLEHIELDRSIETEEAPADSVTLITVHNTKGLEWRRVILTGLEQGVFPRDDKEGDDLEEERRLFYVGVTRAMDELYLCSCASRRLYGRTNLMAPSRFLREAGESVLRVIGVPPSGFARSRSGGRAAANPQSGPRGYAGQGPGVKTSSDGRWKTGDRIFHDDQGYGAVTGVDEGEDGPVIKVRFDNGHENRFLSLYQSGNFTKMGNDE